MRDALEIVDAVLFPRSFVQHALQIVGGLVVFGLLLLNDNVSYSELAAAGAVLLCFSLDAASHAIVYQVRRRQK